MCGALSVLVKRRREGCGQVWGWRKGGAGLQGETQGAMGGDSPTGDWSEGSSPSSALRLQSLRPPRGGAVGQGPWGWRRDPWGWHAASEEEARTKLSAVISPGRGGWDRSGSLCSRRGN